MKCRKTEVNAACDRGTVLGDIMQQLGCMGNLLGRLQDSYIKWIMVCNKWYIIKSTNTSWWKMWIFKRTSITKCNFGYGMRCEVWVGVTARYAVSVARALKDPFKLPLIPRKGICRVALLMWALHCIVYTILITLQTEK
jgi:hypothetical protein